MADEVKVEKIVYEETQIEWKTSNYSQLDKIQSPIFSIADAEYNLVLKRDTDEYHMGIVVVFYLMKNNAEQKCIFSLKKLDGSVVQLLPSTNDCLVEGKNCINHYEMERRRSVFLRGNVLTVLCTPEREVVHSVKLEKAKSLELTGLDTLSANFKNLFGDKETCDTTLKVKDKEYKAHRTVLMARSTVFAAMFKHDTSERQTGIITIPDCDPESFQEFLAYLYSGKLETMSVCSALSMYDTSDKYDVQELKAFCVEYLMHGFTIENICTIVVFANKYEETELFSAAQKFFTKNVIKISVTSEWEFLMRDDFRLANKLLKGMIKERVRD